MAKLRQEKQVLKREEQVIFGMRELFEQYGYRKFEMSKFEEYDFYAENRSFLNSERILTFTGSDGTLLAMKPDVTLSIIKNTKGTRESADRVYYHENVYRAERGSGEFREIMQAGAEYIGEVDTYATLEMLLLAIESLELMNSPWILDVSHMGLVAGLLEETGLGTGRQKQILHCIREKNGHEIRGICRESKVEPELAEKIAVLAGLYGSLEETLASVRALCCNKKMEQAVAELEELYRCLKARGMVKHVNLDFSIVNDMDYYNGIMFQGFIEGVPCGILSGGRYDNLVQRLGKKVEAIGFAVYLDFLKRFWQEKKEYDVDVLLLYGEDTDAAAVAEAAARITDGGESVMVKKMDAGEIRYRRKLCMGNGGL